MDMSYVRDSPPVGIVPGLNYPRCRRARCRAPQGLSRTQMRSWRRQRASARELGRIHELRLGFDILANVLPKNETEKFSKVQVLRYAIQYIEQLSEMNASVEGPAASTSITTSNNSSGSTAIASSSCAVTTPPLPWSAPHHHQPHLYSDYDDSDISHSPGMASPASIHSSSGGSSTGICSPGHPASHCQDSPLPAQVLHDLDQFAICQSSTDLLLPGSLPEWLPADDVTPGLDDVFAPVLPALPPSGQFRESPLTASHGHTDPCPPHPSAGQLPVLPSMEKAIMEATLKTPQQQGHNFCQQPMMNTMPATGYQPNTDVRDYHMFAGLDTPIPFSADMNHGHYMPCAAY